MRTSQNVKGDNAKSAHIAKGSRKIPPGTIPSQKIPNQKIPTWNIRTHFIDCPSSRFLHSFFNTLSINGRGDEESTCAFSQDEKV